MTDTPEIQRIRAALAAGPTPGPWHRGAHHGLLIYGNDGFAIANAVTYHGRHGCADENNADYISACNPSAMTAILAQIDAQSKRIAAFKLLVTSLEDQRSQLWEEIGAARESKATLQSERDAYGSD